MELTSDDKKLLKQANNASVAKKELGEVMAKKLAMRVKELEAVDSIEDLLAGPGRWELLQQNRAGTYSGRLNGHYRLIVKFIAVEPNDEESADEGTVEVVAIEEQTVEEVAIDEEQLAELLEIVDYHEKKNFR